MDYSLTLGYSLGNANGVSKGFYSSVVTFAAPWTWVVSTVGVGSSRDRSTEILVKAQSKEEILEAGSSMVLEASGAGCYEQD